GTHSAQQRLAFEELLAHHLSLLQRRETLRRETAPRLPKSSGMEKQFLSQLPFRLTAAQQRVVAEIQQDLGQDQPMLRLVQGDVGSGKTLVAALAALTTCAGGFQTAVMAPTEILAEQHRNNFDAWLSPLGIEVAWLTGRVKGKARERQLQRIGD